MNDGLLHVLLTGLFLLITHNTIPITGTFVLTVKFINYTNPTGLCAECSGGLESVTSADHLTPVCCDESPFRSDNCDNTGEARCDTRFRWTLRPFGAPLETRPVTMMPTKPLYHFTDCDLSNTTCPFSEMSTTFSQGPTGFLGVAANPLPVVPIPTTNLPFTSWPGQVQFFIEALDSRLPNIIDSLLINLDNLQLGVDFTEEMTFTGYHNVSHMTMSFRVACQTGFCGRDCTVRRLTGNVVNPRIFSCHTDGTIICTDSRYDPSASCDECLHSLDISTECSTCLEPNFDPDTNCTACLSGYDIETNCSTCLTHYDLSTNCTTCSLGSSYDPVTDCTACLEKRRDPMTNCNQCLPNHDPSTACSTCLFGFDISRNCSVCLPGRNISTNCTTCLSGYARENCEQESSSSPLNVAVVGGVAGGVGGALLLVIIVLVVIVCVLMCQVRRRGQVKFELSDDTVTNHYSVNGLQTNSGSSVEHKFQNPIYGPTGELELKSGTGTSETHQFSNSLYETAEIHKKDELRHPSTSPTVTTGEQPVYDEANLPPPTASVPEKKTTHPSKSPGAYDEVADDLSPSNGAPSSGVYDTAHPTHPVESEPSANAYAELEGPTNVYSTLEEPTSVYTAVEEPKNGYSALDEPINTHSALEGPTEDYSELNHPAKAVAKPEGPKPVSNYSRLNGHNAEDLPMYDVSSHDPPQTHPQTLPPHEAALYDTANFPNEPTPDYTETADFIGLPSDSSPSGSVRPHPYDYVETELNGGSVPPAVDPRVRPVYTNTMPGKITAEAESHYDLGL